MTRARGGRPRKCLWNNRILIEWEQEPRNREKAEEQTQKFVGSSYNIGPGAPSRDYRVATLRCASCNP